MLSSRDISVQVWTVCGHLHCKKGRCLATALPSLDRILGLGNLQGLSRGSGECSTSGRIGTTEQERNSEDSEAFSVPWVLWKLPQKALLGFQPGPTTAPEKPNTADQVAEWDPEKPGYPRVGGHRVSTGEGPGILPSLSLHGWLFHCFPLQLG